MALIDRHARLHIIKPSGSDFFGSPAANQMTVDGLHMSFVVERSLDPSPDTCRVSVSNLSSRTRHALSQRPTRIQLEAGYGADLSLLFSGDLMEAPSRLDTATWITEIVAGDGMRAYRHARARRSFGPGTPRKDLIKDVAASMGLRVPKTVDEAIDLGRTVLNGESLAGPAAAALTELLAPTGRSWSIHGGQLRVLRDDELVRSDIPLVSPGTGLVGSPEIMPQDRPGGRARVMLEVALDGRLEPGMGIRLESRDVRGTYKVRTLRHDGDTHGDGAWVTRITASEISR